MTDIRVLTSLAIREAYLELIPLFESQTGRHVATTWAGTVDIQRRMAAGETYDVIMMSDTGLKALAQSRTVLGDTLIPMVKCGIGVAVPRGAAQPDIGTVDAFKAALINARSVGYSTGPSGVYLKSLFDRLGVAEVLAGKTCIVPSGATVGTILASGEADIGLQQIPELIHVDGADYIGPLPDPIQHVTTFSGAVHQASANADAAKTLIGFLTAPEAVPVIRRHGLEPG